MPSTLKPLGCLLGTPGVDYETHYVQPAAGQTYVAGDWLIWSGSGTAVVAAAAGNAVGANDLIGQSDHNAVTILANATGNQRGAVRVPLANSNFVFPVGAQAAAVAQTVATISLTDVDASTTYDLVRATDGTWCLSTAETSNGKFKLMGLFGDDEKKNNYGVATFPYVKVKPVLASFWQSGS